MNTLHIPSPDDNPQEWIKALFTFFQNLNQQGETDIVSTYQTLRVAEKTATSRELAHQILIMKKAAFDRMDALTRTANDSAEALRLCRVFLMATSDYQHFRKLWVLREDEILNEQRNSSWES